MGERTYNASVVTVAAVVIVVALTALSAVSYVTTNGWTGEGCLVLSVFGWHIGPLFPSGTPFVCELSSPGPRNLVS